MATTAKALAKQNYNLNQQLLAARNSQNHRTRKELNAMVKLTRELNEKLNLIISEQLKHVEQLVNEIEALKMDNTNLKRQIAEYEAPDEVNPG